MKRIIFSAWVLALMSTVPLKAQVTIGSLETPAEGALLDLKSYNETTPGGQTTNIGGLLLPRVELTSLTSLTPFNVQSADYLKHTGLVVYNVATVGNVLSPGIYNWSGSKWEKFSEAKAEYIWMPSFELPYPVNKVGEVQQIDLFAIYSESFETGNATHNFPQYGTAIDPTNGHGYYASESTPAVKPFGDAITRNDLIYIITDYQTNVIEVVSITGGVLTYKMKLPVAPENAYVNILLKKKQ